MGQIICIIEMGADEKAQVGAIWMTCHSIKMSTIKFRTMEIYYACISRGEEVQVFLCTIVWAWSSAPSNTNFQGNWKYLPGLEKQFQKHFTQDLLRTSLSTRSGPLDIVGWMGTPLQLVHYGLPKKLAKFICNCKIWILLSYFKLNQIFQQKWVSYYNFNLVTQISREILVMWENNFFGMF